MESNGPFDEQPQEGGAIETTSQENFGMGVLGAFLGSLVGVVVIIVLSRLGIIAAVSGLVMSLAALKGYEKLGGVLTKRGVVVAVALIVVMTFVADWVDWGIVVAEALNMDLVEAVFSLPAVMDAGLIDMGAYLGNLAMLYVFVAVGAVAVIASALRPAKSE